MQAVLEARRTQPDWTAYLVPMSIKYRYRQPIGPLLEKRTRSMEQSLFQRIDRDPLPRRLALIVAELLHRQELIHHLKPDPHRLVELSERVQDVRQGGPHGDGVPLLRTNRRHPGPDYGSSLAAQFLPAKVTAAR